MFVRILAMLLGLGGLYSFGLSIAEEKTFEWIFIPIGWACAIFLVYGVFGVDLTKMPKLGGAENQEKDDKKPTYSELASTGRAKWLAKSKLIGFLGLLAFGVQVGFILFEVWANMENARLGATIFKVVSVILMVVFLSRVGEDFIRNQRYSKALKLGCAALLVITFGLGFFIMYIFLLWYCADEARFESARTLEDKMVAGI